MIGLRNLDRSQWINAPAPTPFDKLEPHIEEIRPETVIPVRRQDTNLFGMLHITIQARRQVEIVAITSAKEIHLLVGSNIDECNSAFQSPVAAEIREVKQLRRLDTQSHAHTAHADNDQMNRPVALPRDRLTI